MARARRGVYSYEQQKTIFNPRSIAIYGMSQTAGSPGQRVVAQNAHYTGRILRINPKYERIGDAPCYPDIGSLPEIPDVVLCAVPRDAIEKVVLECAQGGVPAVAVFASGYAETGKPERIAMQQRLTGIARETGIRIIGPNCMGFVNFVSRAVVSFTSTDVTEPMAATAGIGIVSQSGALGFGLAQAVQNGVVVSHVIATGNSCDVNIADNIAYLAGEPSCNAIACVLEGLPEPALLMEAADIAWRAGKPLVIGKLGTGSQGAEAAKSHTGSLAGSLAAYRAAFERHGAVMLEGLDGIMEMCSFLSKAGRPTGRGVAIVATSGGGGIAGTDRAEAHGVAMPQPAPQVRSVLEANVPEYGSPRNPCDVTTAAQTNMQLLLNCVDAFLGDPAYSTLLYPGVTLSQRTLGRRAPLSELARKHGKPICLPYMGGWTGGPGTKEAMLDPGFGWFFSLDDCFRTIAAWHWRDDKRLAEVKNGPRRLVRLSSPEARDKAAKLIQSSPNAILTEREAKAVLAAYGIPVVREELVQSATAAADAAARLGYPVALKVESPDLPHKTEAGAIRLNLKSAGEVESAYGAVLASVAAFNPRARINGVLVQPMAGAGIELMMGIRVDPLFGPLLVTGLGGVLVELLKDTAVELAPVTRQEARGMLSRLKGRAALEGFRGAEPVDQDAVAEVLVRLSEFADDQRERVSEVDVNPVICSGGRIMAVDALIAKAGTAEAPAAAACAVAA